MGYGGGQVIISGFTFYNEFDLLELRLEELDPVVDHFIIVQADQTFRGQEKPRYFDRRSPRWAAYSNKITVVNTSLEGFPGPWEREIWQRNLILTAAQDLFDPEDILIVSDADEIPRRSVVAGFKESFDVPVRLYTPTYYYALNCLAGADEAIKVAKIKDIDTAEALRRGDPKDTKLIDNAGWHFSYLGDAEWISNKIRSFSHSELDHDDIHWNIAKSMGALTDPFGFGQKFEIKQVDDTWPEAVKKNPERYRKYIWQA